MIKFKNKKRTIIVKIKDQGVTNIKFRLAL